MESLTAKIFQSPKTILTNRDLALIWQETNTDHLKSKISYYVKKGTLIQLTRGIYAKNKNYSLKELAVSIYRPAYISFETVLREEGIIFQYSDVVFIAGPYSKTITVNQHAFIFRRLKDCLLYNPTGVKSQDNIAIATSARAFLDTIYLFPMYYFDNLSQMNWNECFELADIYDNRQLVKRLDNYYKKYAK